MQENVKNNIFDFKVVTKAYHINGTHAAPSSVIGNLLCNF